MKWCEILEIKYIKFCFVKGWFFFLVYIWFLFFVLFLLDIFVENYRFREILFLNYLFFQIINYLIVYYLLELVVLMKK